MNDKFKLLVIFLFTSFTLSFAQTHSIQSDIRNILSDWLDAHNSGNINSIKNFIRNDYSAEVVNDDLIESHSDFYYHFYEMNGKLNEKPHKVITEEETKLVIQFTRKDVNKSEKYKPENILQVEIELCSDMKLHKSFGLASLACVLKKDN